jgi:hypothetical protein
MGAASLGASSGAGGYLILHPHAPLALAPPGFIGRTIAVFGLARPNEPQGNTLLIEDGTCGLPGSDSATPTLFRTGDGGLGVAWCDAPSGLHVTAVGQPQFVNGVAGRVTLSAVG